MRGRVSRKKKVIWRRRRRATPGCWSGWLGGGGSSRRGEARLDWGRGNARVGDQLVVISFCLKMYLLRQGEGSAAWSIVGEAYVHGLMYGEALEMLDRGYQITNKAPTPRAVVMVYILAHSPPGEKKTCNTEQGLSRHSVEKQPRILNTFQ